MGRMSVAAWARALDPLKGSSEPVENDGRRECFDVVAVVAVLAEEEEEGFIGLSGRPSEQADLGEDSSEP